MNQSVTVSEVNASTANAGTGKPGLQEADQQPGEPGKVDVTEAAIVVIGTGPVGMHLLSELARNSVTEPVIIYGEEPVKPYNRVRLSDYLSGGISPQDLDLAEVENNECRIEYRYGCKVESVDKQSRKIVDADGRLQSYSKLVFATGSTPFVPKIGNSFYQGVYTFRTLAEADELLSRKIRSRHTVIIGGGLLGLETARAMQRFNTRITIVEHNRWLMMQQLDESGSEALQDYVLGSGISLVLGDSVVSVTGNNRVEGLSLRSGRTLDCDTLIIATGVRPNISLAMDAGISCNRGIRVDDSLQTSEHGIYAIGECAEHRDNVYGIVQPGLEQASVLANGLTGGNAQYSGSISTTRLKVMNKAVLSSGRTGVDEESRTSVNEYVYSDKGNGVYRKIRVFGNRVIGAVAVGDWHESALLNEAIEQKRTVWFWQLQRFKHSGYLWGSEDEVDVTTWPAVANVCNCNRVTRGELSTAIESGCNNIACLMQKTGAGSVCGSCKPLLSEMLGSEVAREPDRWWKTLSVMAFVSAILVALFLVVNRIPYPDSVQVTIRWDELWRNSLFKQVSGFSILALVAIGLFLSLRKRIDKITIGKFDAWRLTHTVLGVLALMVLVVHTGFSLGDELNLALMMNFLLLAAVGGYAGKVIASEHKLSVKQARRQRAFWNGAHIMLVWTFPVLLTFHVLKTYYY